MIVMFVAGGLLSSGERDTRFRFDETVIVHDWATWILVTLVVGHLYLALIHRSTRPGLRNGRRRRGSRMGAPTPLEIVER